MANRILDTLLNALEWHDAIVRLLGTAEIVVVQAIVFTVGVAVQEEVLAVGDIKAVQDVQLIVHGGRCFVTAKAELRGAQIVQAPFPCDGWV